MPSNILPKNARMAPVDLRPEIVRRSMDNQPRAFTEATDSWRRDPGALSALEMVGAPFEAMGQYFGDATLDATNSPAWATAAYMLGSGMLGNAPIKGLQKVGKAGLQILDNGITHGQGPLAGLQHLAPGVMKREGGNWFPGEIERQVYHMQGRTPNKDISDWIAGPMKNYIQKRFASPNDEIRKLYDQGIEVSPPVEIGYTQSALINNKRSKFRDPALTQSRMAETDAGRNWEDRADSAITPDVELLDAARASIPMPRYLTQWEPRERIGAETLKFLRQNNAVDKIPTEILGTDLQRKKGASKEVAGAVADYVKQNKQILDDLRIPRDPDAISINTYYNRLEKDRVARGGQYRTWDDPFRLSLDDKLENPDIVMQRRNINALDKSYAHLDAPPGAPYKGAGFKYGNNLRYNPFSGQGTTLDIIRNDFGKNAPWLANVPSDNPINSFAHVRHNRLRSPNNIATMPEFGHMFDVMNEDMQAGRLTPQQLKSGSFSVEAAGRRAAEYNAEKIKAMEKTKLIEAAGFPTMKEYDSGHKWLELKHSKDNNLTAKALKDEGNAMGHCVGGYCNQVLGGDTRIISLRDTKGQPRATIELRRDKYVDPTSGEPLSKAWSIHQIKGPANRKPSAAEIPMIQDFVMNQGPWGGIKGDFHNTDLADLKELMQHEGTPESTKRMQPFVDWARETMDTQGHPYFDKLEAENKLLNLQGGRDLPTK